MHDRITITQEKGMYVARFAYDPLKIAAVKGAGFRWNPTAKFWWTTSPVVAAKLDPAAAEKANAAIAASRATDADIDVPAPPGLSYYPFQKAAIAYAMSRRNVGFFDEMGLGKTVEAIGVVNADPTVTSVLVISRAGHKLLWEEHLHRWLVRPLSVGIAEAKSFPATDVVIVNWEILHKLRAAIDTRSWDMVIADEVHFAKNEKALRTQALFGHKKTGKTPIAARRKLLLTGTPIVNRPRELWTLVEALDPDDLGRSFFKFASRYCAAHKVSIGWGKTAWDFTGASNLDELNQKLRAKFMVRRLKKDVLTELPPKTRTIVPFDPPASLKPTLAAEREEYEKHKEAIRRALEAAAEAAKRKDKEAYKAEAEKLRRARKIAFERMSKVRHDTEVAKIPLAIEYITEVLEEEDKVVVLAHHLDVVDAIKEAFPNAAVVTGRTDSQKQKLEVDRFQTDPAVRVIVGTYPGALGTGWTLTAARVAIALALDWVPGNVSQAEDRLHRIGQKDNVLIQHLVFDGSVDAEMARLIIEKQEVIDNALDAETVVAAPEVPEVAAPAPEPTRPVGNGHAPAIDLDTIPF